MRHGTHLLGPHPEGPWAGALAPFDSFPLYHPCFLGTIKAMEIILLEGSFQELLPWLRLLTGFDVIFLTIGFLLFEWVIEG